MVVLSHLRQTFWATSAEDIWRPLSAFPHFVARPFLAVILGLCNGTFAVWLLWIMSAFVLSLQFFLRAHQSPLTRAHDYLEDACLRRYPRLLIPILASVIFAWALHAAHLMRNVALAHTLGEPYASGWLASWYTFPASLSGAIKSATWQSFFAYDRSATYNGVLWTMDKGFYGSLILFAFLGLFGHRRSRILLYLLIALSSRFLGLDWLNAFVFGMALCDLFVNHNKLPHLQRVWHQPLVTHLRGRCGTGALWLILVAGVGLPNYRGVSYLIIGVTAMALSVVSTSSQRLLSHAWLQFLGRISFGLYLVHFPIICSFSCWAYLATVARYGHVGAALLSSTLTCVLSIVCGYLFFIIADRPGIRFSRLFSSLVRNAPSPAPQRTGSVATTFVPPPSPAPHQAAPVPSVAEL